MPLMVEGGRIPPRWVLEGKCRPVVSCNDRPPDHVNIAFINNMPDAALEDTELQFFDLLDEASGDLLIYLKLYSLTGIPRTERGQRHLNSFYYSLDELWQDQFDGVIVTGTEPRQPNLQDEPYWKVLAQVFDWAERNTVSAVLSCLAAHASVLHCDGIARHRLPDKQFGVFNFKKAADSPLTSTIGDGVCFSHSRWNEVKASELADCGYLVLTQSPTAGVDTFVKKRGKSLFVHFQGHPEYGAETLLKEYRRDIRRFLKGERETYPTMPNGYFDAARARLATDFRETILARPLSDRGEALMESFPDGELARTLRKTRRSCATEIYRNWLHYLISGKASMAKSSLGAPISEPVQTGRMALPQSERGTCRK